MIPRINLCVKRLTCQEINITSLVVTIFCVDTVPARRLIKKRVFVGSAVILSSLIILGLMCKCYRICTLKKRKKTTEDGPGCGEHLALTSCIHHHDQLLHDGGNVSPRVYSDSDQQNGEAVVLNNIHISSLREETVCTSEDDVEDTCMSSDHTVVNLKCSVIIPPNLDPVPTVPPPTYDDVFRTRIERAREEGEETRGLTGFFANRTVDS